MLLNYFRLAIRLLLRNPFFAFINIVGLAIGFTSFYTLWEYSISELRSDQYHKDADRIARIGVNWRWSGDGDNTWGHIIFGFSKSSIFPAVKEDFPEVESTLRILHQPNFNPSLVNHRDRVVISLEDDNGQDRHFKEENAAYSDSNLFTFFSIPLIYGQAQHVLSHMNDVVLSQSTARKYFGDKDPTGELLKLNDTTTLKVSGVFVDLPHYTHLNFDLVISNVDLLTRWNTSYFSPTMCYLKLNNNNFKGFEAKLNQRVERYWEGTLRAMPQVKLDMFVQPLPEIIFSQHFAQDNFYPRSKTFLFTLAFIALSVLVMAWVNYVNLSVTRTMRRFKEVATRKVSGAGSRDMIRQFMTEAVVTNVLAIAISVTLIQIIRLPASLLFNIEVPEFSDLSFSSISILASVILTGILLSGLYPAVISLTFQPRALFNMGSSGYRKRIIPSLLTISQLAVAVIFILLGFTVSLQLSHVLRMDTGIKMDHAIVIEGPVVKPKNYKSIQASLKKEILSNSNVSAATIATFPLAVNTGAVFNSRRAGSDLWFGMDSNCVDEDFIPFYGLKLLAGRNFIKDDKPDVIIVSRFAAERLGFNSPEDAVGTIINVRSAEGVGDGIWQDAEVIGVFENFRNTSFLNVNESNSEANDEGRGVVLLYEKQELNTTFFIPEIMSIRVSPQDIDGTMAKIKALFSRQFPGAMFSWYFLDQRISDVYGHEKTARNQIILFTALAMIIACLGLLGMITNKVVEKTKEICIRKVLGAEVHQISQILLSTTVKQIAISAVVGIPIAYYLTELYLEKYSERISLQWWHFGMPILILVIIMFSSVASVLWKATRINPADALKCE